MKYMVYFGPRVEAVREAREAIIQILDSKVEQETMRCAVKAFVEVCAVKNNSISNCNFTAGEREDPTEEDEE
jgi:hypothetical protein